MSSGGSKTVQTTNTQPWAASQPYLTDIMASAKNNYLNGVGTKYYPGNTVAGFDNTTSAALQKIYNTGQTAANSITPQATGAANGILQSGGLSGGQNTALGLLGDIGSGANGITTGGAYSGLLGSYGATPTSSGTNLAGIADAKNASTLSDDYLKAQAFADQKAQTALTQALSGSGRFGGNAATAQAFADQIAGNDATQNAAQLDRQKQLMLSANGQIDNSAAQKLQGQLGLLSGLTGVQGQNIANQAGAANSMASIGQQGQANTLGVLGLLPTIDASRYYDANQMLGVGQQYDQLHQQQIQAAIDKFNFQNSAPVNALGNYLNLVSGATGNYSTQQVKAPSPSIWQQALGGLLALA